MKFALVSNDIFISSEINGAVEVDSGVARLCPNIIKLLEQSEEKIVTSFDDCVFIQQSKDLFKICKLRLTKDLDNTYSTADGLVHLNTFYMNNQMFKAHLSKVVTENYTSIFLFPKSLINYSPTVVCVQVVLSLNVHTNGDGDAAAAKVGIMPPGVSMFDFRANSSTDCIKESWPELDLYQSTLNNSIRNLLKDIYICTNCIIEPANPPIIQVFNKDDDTNRYLSIEKLIIKDIDYLNSKSCKVDSNYRFINQINKYTSITIDTINGNDSKNSECYDINKKKSNLKPNTNNTNSFQRKETKGPLPPLTLENTTQHPPSSSYLHHGQPFEEIYQIINVSKENQSYLDHLNTQSSKGILLHGMPGIGKTLLVKSIAKSTKSVLFSLEGPSLLSPFVGETEVRLQQIFQYIMNFCYDINNTNNTTFKTVVILFIDEIDALCQKRTNESTNATDSRLVATLLVLMDGFNKKESEKYKKIRNLFKIVGATNRPNVIDQALRRPGRFDREIHMQVPDEQSRYHILCFYLKNKPNIIVSDKTIKQIAKLTNGFVGADLNALCRQTVLDNLGVINKANKDVVENATINDDAVLQISIQDFTRVLKDMNPPSLIRAHKVNVDVKNWDDIGGYNKTKQLLKECIEWPLLYSSSFHHLGLKMPNGIIMYGPPGCAKTTFAKVLASTAGCSFYSLSSAQVYSSFVGETEKNLIQVIQKARQTAPSIVFFDELDALVGKRVTTSSTSNNSEGGGGGGGENDKLLCSLLMEMDGCLNNNSSDGINNVIFIAATNRIDMIDDALLRPGRFDYKIYIPLPDYESRIAIFYVHTKHMPIAECVNVPYLAEKTLDFSGADIQSLCRETALFALREVGLHCRYITMSHFITTLKTFVPSKNR